MFHTVYFWLKPDLSEEDRALFEAELLQLTKLEELTQGHASRCADTDDRPGVTDHSFDHSLILQFATREDHDAYQQPEHAGHQRFLETCKTFWERVLVLDSQPF